MEGQRGMRWTCDGAASLPLDFHTAFPCARFLLLPYTRTVSALTRITPGQVRSTPWSENEWVGS